MANPSLRGRQGWALPTRYLLAALKGFFFGAECRLARAFLEELNLHISGALLLRIPHFLAIWIDRQSQFLRTQRSIQKDAPDGRQGDEQASTYACFPALCWG